MHPPPYTKCGATCGPEAEVKLPDGRTQVVRLPRPLAATPISEGEWRLGYTSALGLVIKPFVKSRKGAFRIAVHLLSILTCADNLEPLAHSNLQHRTFRMAALDSLSAENLLNKWRVLFCVLAVYFTYKVFSLPRVGGGSV